MALAMTNEELKIRLSETRYKQENREQFEQDRLNQSKREAAKALIAAGQGDVLKTIKQLQDAFDGTTMRIELEGKVIYKDDRKPKSKEVKEAAAYKPNF